MHKPLNAIAGLIIIGMVIAATLQAGEEKLEPVLRTVTSTESVAVTYLAGKGFKITGADPKGAVQVLKGRMGLLPMIADGKLSGVGVVTFEPAKDKDAATWPDLKAVEDVKPQRIATALTLTFKPVFVKSVLQGFALVTIAARKGADSAGDVVQVGKEDKSVEHKTISFLLPKEPSAALWYGVMLVPAFGEDGKALKGFDVSLVATPRKAN